MAALVLFTNDLRIKDHEPLSDAMTNEDEVHACYFFYQPALKKYGGKRNQFLVDSLILLEKNLSHLGVRLHVMNARTLLEAELSFKKLLKTEQISSLFFHEPVDPDEQNLLKSLTNSDRESHCYCDQTLFKPGQILNGSHEPFRVFTPFFRKASAAIGQNRALIQTKALPKKHASLESLPISIPDWLQLENLDSRFPAGEKAALSRLKDFLSADVLDYAKGRDFFALDATSHLSPYLALGLLSIRTCISELFSAQERTLHQAQSGASIFFTELLWREFYRHLWVFFPKLSLGDPFRDNGKLISWRTSKKDLLAWQEGRTGIPIIDAAMRNLNQSGFMHNRLRMIVASFLSKNLLLDWRLGEQYFLKHLIDADLPSNNGGWQWSASVGVDAQPYFRVFNPVSQSERYDEKGDFIRSYVPELTQLNEKLIHAPFLKLSENELKKLGYIAPICELADSRKHAIETYAKAFRGER